MMSQVKSFLIAAGGALAILGAAGALDAQQRQAPQPPLAAGAGPQRIEMIVHGMSCPFCAYGLEKKLRKIEGVDSLSIDFKTGRVTLAVPDGSKVTDEQIRDLVKDAGFEVMEIKRSPLAGSPPESSTDTT